MNDMWEQAPEIELRYVMYAGRMLIYLESA